MDRKRSKAWLFLRLRGRLIRNGLHQLFEQSQLRLGVIAFLSLMIWGGLYVLFAEGFFFLRNLETTYPISYRIVELLFGVFFLTLTGLMVFTTGLLLHSSLFRSPEAGYLLTTPATADQVFAHKFLEAMLYSGWAFLLLGTPLLVAYGIEMSAAWTYYVLFVPYLVGFLLLPSAIGGVGCLVIVYLFPRWKKWILLLLLAALGVMVVTWFLSLAGSRASDAITDGGWLRRLIDHLKPSQWPFLPSRWMTAGLMQAAQARRIGDLDEPLFYLMLVWSNGLMVYLVGAVLARRIYRSAYSAATGDARNSRRRRTHPFDWFVLRLLAWTDRRTRAFVVKDLRTFRRDPAQWVQVLIFGTLLLFYFLLIPRMPHGHYVLYQRILIGLLNVGVIGLMLATYTSRFVFPLMSLEGRSFWILGLLPIRRDHLLVCKFAYAATLTTTASVAMGLLSEWMLDLPWPVIVIHVIAVAVMALGLCGLGVGLGALLVNLREPNPSKIAAGFGGTINLLLSLLYAVAVIALASVPTFLYFADKELRQLDVMVVERMTRWTLVGVGSLVLLGAFAVGVPLVMGFRAFRRMEF